jgi:hypothetical protein
MSSVDSDFPRRLSVAKVSTYGHGWRELTSTAMKNPALAVQNTFLRPHPSGNPNNFTFGEMTTVHAHGNFGHGFGPDYGPNPNISTQIPDKGALKHDALISGSGDHWATNTMRVLKGTSGLNKPLLGSSEETRMSVVFGHEIGISEVARGGKNALLSAMSALYLAKHGRMSAKEFYDPKVGFVGSGDKGAERLRTLSEMKPVKAMHPEGLKQHFDEVVSKRDKWQGKSFDDWLSHKHDKWTQKY